MKEISLEKDLYDPVLNWLTTWFVHHEANALSGQMSEIFSANVSQVPAEDNGGLWSRPDLAAVVFSKGRFVPQWSWSLVTIEVKTAKNINEQAVYETIGHTRYSNYSFLFWQAGDKLGPKDRRIVELCSQYQVGAITSEHPEDAKSFRLRNMPARVSIEPHLVDGFIKARFPEFKQTQIEKWLSLHGWIAD